VLIVGGITRAAGRAGYVNDHRWQDRVRVHPASPDPGIVAVSDRATVRSRPAVPEMVVQSPGFNEERLGAITPATATLATGRPRAGRRQCPILARPRGHARIPTANPLP